MSQDIVLCEQCDAVHRWRPLASSEVARCRRCGAVIARGHRLSVSGLLALTVAAGVMLAVAVSTPVMTLQLRGDESAAGQAGSASRGFSTSISTIRTGGPSG